MNHFYDKDGNCIYGLKEARLKAALPSPTTVLKLLSAPALQEYFARQMHVATATTPRLSHWSDDDYFNACSRWADEHGQEARDFGGNVHDEIQAFHRTGWANPCASDQAKLYFQWHERFIAKTVLCEEVVMGEGYAGRLDNLSQMRDGRLILLDVKTQNTTKRNGRFNKYSTWALQMGAYSGCVTPAPEALVSICLSSNAPATLEAHFWPEHPSFYTDLFKALLKVWCFSSNYYPANAPGSIMSHPNQGTLC